MNQQEKISRESDWSLQRTRSRKFRERIDHLLAVGRKVTTSRLQFCSKKSAHNTKTTGSNRLKFSGKTVRFTRNRLVPHLFQSERNRFLASGSPDCHLKLKGVLRRSPNRSGTNVNSSTVSRISEREEFWQPHAWLWTFGRDKRAPFSKKSLSTSFFFLSRKNLRRKENRRRTPFKNKTKIEVVLCLKEERGKVDLGTGCVAHAWRRTGTRRRRKTD